MVWCDGVVCGVLLGVFVSDWVLVVGVCSGGLWWMLFV
jgi:hypothetical protein